MTVAYKLYDGSLIGGARDDSTDTTQKVGVQLGTILKGFDSQKSTTGPPVTPYGEVELQYVKFSGTVAQADWVLIDTPNQRCIQAASGAVLTGRGRVGLALQAQVSGNFGWVLIRGVHDFANIATLGAGQLHLPIYLTATAGRASTTVVANYKADGAFARVDTFTAGPTAGNLVELYYPVVTGNG